MNKILLTLLGIGFVATACYGSQQDTYNVDERGNVTKGDFQATMKERDNPYHRDMQGRATGDKPNRDTRIQKGR